ncbi:MAG: hypothetical protein LC104_05615 [Bacteroidales bacterium]|nr:hypothetical protein [Bacteroidales bacterium]
MALIIPGKTTCVVCGRVIVASGDAVSFPAFLKPGHRLSRFSDAVGHIGCIQSSADGQEAQRLHRRYLEIWESRPQNVSFEQAEAWGREAFKELDS